MIKISTDNLLARKVSTSSENKNPQKKQKESKSDKEENNFPFHYHMEKQNKPEELKKKGKGDFEVNFKTEAKSRQPVLKNQKEIPLASKEAIQKNPIKEKVESNEPSPLIKQNVKTISFPNPKISTSTKIPKKVNLDSPKLKTADQPKYGIQTKIKERSTRKKTDPTTEFQQKKHNSNKKENLNTNKTNLVTLSANNKNITSEATHIDSTAKFTGKLHTQPLADLMLSHLQKGTKHITINLTPRHLGSLKIKLDLSSPQPKIQIEAEKEKTHEIMQKQLHQLTKTITQTYPKMNISLTPQSKSSLTANYAHKTHLATKRNQKAQSHIPYTDTPSHPT